MNVPDWKWALLCQCCWQIYSDVSICFELWKMKSTSYRTSRQLRNPFNFSYKNWCSLNKAKGAKHFTVLKVWTLGLPPLSYVINFDDNDWDAIIISCSLNAMRSFKIHKCLVAASIFGSFIWNASHLKVPFVVFCSLHYYLNESFGTSNEKWMFIQKRECCSNTLKSEFGICACVFIMCDSLH